MLTMSAWAGIRNTSGEPLLVCIEGGTAHVQLNPGVTDAQLDLEWLGENPSTGELRGRPRCAVGWYWHLLLPAEAYFTRVSEDVRTPGAVLEVELRARVLEAGTQLGAEVQQGKADVVTLRSSGKLQQRE